MLTFEQCGNCGELRVEHYGAVTEDKCVKCAAVEQRALTKEPATESLSPQQIDTIVYADLPKAEQRRQIRIMALIPGQFEHQNGPQEFNILDISKAGAKLRMAQKVPNGTLTLTFPGVGQLHATVTWRDGFTGGVTFIEPHDEVVAIIAKRAPRLEPLLRAA